MGNQTEELIKLAKPVAKKNEFEIEFLQCGAEAIPLPATGLVPIVLFPTTGGLDLQSTTASYGHKLVFLFVGGFIIALVTITTVFTAKIKFQLIRVLL